MRASSIIVYLTIAVTAVFANPIDGTASESISKRQLWNACFNEGYNDGDAAGCNAAEGRKRSAAELEKRLDCSSGSLATAFNEGFNDGFNVGWNRCS